jgi:MSHA biogenesis protein MshP
MYPDLPNRIMPGVSRRRQYGVSILSALFLLVVLAGLGAALVNISSSQHITTAQDLEVSRAYQAARAGIEWGLYQTMTPLPAGGTGAPGTAVCTTPPALTLGGNLSGFAVAVSCTRDVFSEGSTTVAVYQITSLATSGTPGTSLYVERQLQATASR